MIGDEKKPSLWQLFRTGDRDADVQKMHAQPGRTVQQKAVKGAVLCIQLFRIDAKRRDGDHRDIQKKQCGDAAQNTQNDLQQGIPVLSTQYTLL